MTATTSEKKSMQVTNYLSRNSLVLALLLGMLTGCSDMHQHALPYQPPEQGDLTGQSPKVTEGVHRWTLRPYVINGVRYVPDIVPVGTVTKGVASWYGPDFHGNKTSCGEVYDMHGMTAAHKTLPMHTKIRVTNRYTGKSVEVRVNDRGPFVTGRIVDLSFEAGKRLGLDKTGIAPVTLEVLGYDPIITARAEAKAPAAVAENTVSQPAPQPLSKVESAPVVAQVQSVAVEPTVTPVALDPVESTPLQAPEVAAPVVAAAAAVSSVDAALPTAPEEPKETVAETVKKAERYMVQIGSFSKLSGAEKIKNAAAFAYSGRTVKIVSTPQGDAAVFKVLVSGFDNKEEAMAFIRKNAISGAFITREN